MSSGFTWVAIGVVPVDAGRVHWSGWWCAGVFVGGQSSFEVRVFLLEHVVFHGEAVVLMLELFAVLAGHSLQTTR